MISCLYIYVHVYHNLLQDQEHSGFELELEALLMSVTFHKVEARLHLIFSKRPLCIALKIHRLTYSKGAE